MSLLCFISTMDLTPKNLFYSKAQFSSLFAPLHTPGPVLHFITAISIYQEVKIMCIVTFCVFPPSPSNDVTNVRWFPLAICVHRIDFHSKLHTVLLYIRQSFDFFHSEQAFPSVLAKALSRIYHGSMVDLRGSWARDACLTQHNRFLKCNYTRRQNITSLHN